MFSSNLGSSVGYLDAISYILSIAYPSKLEHY